MRTASPKHSSTPGAEKRDHEVLGHSGIDDRDRLLDTLFVGPDEVRTLGSGPAEFQKIDGAARTFGDLSLIGELRLGGLVLWLLGPAGGEV